MSENRLTNGYEPVTIKMLVRASGETVCLPSVIAIRPADDTVVGFGQDALEYTDDTFAQISVICPFRRGAVAEFDLASTLFKYLVNTYYYSKVFLSRLKRRPTVVLCSRFEMTGVERIASRDMLMNAGAGKVILADTSFEQGVDEYGTAAIVIALE